MPKAPAAGARSGGTVGRPELVLVDHQRDVKVAHAVSVNIHATASMSDLLLA